MRMGKMMLILDILTIQIVLKFRNYGLLSHKKSHIIRKTKFYIPV